MEESLMIQPLRAEDIHNVVAWNEGQDADFLLQWAGPGYTWPLDAAQLEQRLAASQDADWRMFRILLNGAMIGYFELMQMDRQARTAVFGRFILKEELRGLGYGGRALGQVLRMAFTKMRLKSLRLSVFAWNEDAVQCYKRAGFCITARDGEGRAERLRMQVDNPII